MASSYKIQMKRRLCVIAGCSIILFVTILNISKLQCIYIMADEFGYWTSGSFFSGYDWTGVAVINPYYSFGYGFFLAPLLKIFSSSTAYQAAILMNGIFLCLSFLLACHSLEILFNTIKKEWIYLISLAVSLYASNIGLSQTTMCECLLFLIFWCVFDSFIVLFVEKSNVYVVLSAFFLGFMYTVHMRTLGIVMSGMICMLILLWKKVISKKQFLMFIIVLATILLVYNFVKGQIQSVYASDLTSNVNDYSGQVGKIKFLFSLDGIIAFIKSFCGKVWYLAGTTFMLIFWFVAKCVKSIKLGEFLKREEKSIHTFILFFLCLCILVTLCISSIFMINPSRMDQPIYGRYNEFVLGPVLGIALCWIINQKKPLLKESVLVFGSYILLSFWVCQFYTKFSLTEANYTNVIGLYRFCNKDFSIKVMSIKCLMLGFILYLLLALASKNAENTKKGHIRNRILAVVFIYITGIWIWQGMGYAQERVYAYQQKLTDVKIADIIRKVEDNSEIPIYYIYNSTDVTKIKNRIFSVQFMLKDKSIKIMDYNTFRQGTIDKDAIYIISKKTAVINEISHEYDTLFTGNDLKMFIHHDNEKAEVIRTAVSEQASFFRIENAEKFLSEQSTYTINLGKIEDRGCYDISVHVKFSNIENNQDIYAILQTEEGNILDEAVIKNSEFNNNWVEVSLSADIGFINTNLQLVLSSRGCFSGYVCSASMSRTDSVYREGIDSRAELEDVNTVLKQLNILDIDYVVYGKIPDNMDCVNDILSGINVRVGSYKDFEQGQSLGNCIVVKAEDNIFEYPLLWEEYSLLTSNEKYFVAVRNNAQVVLNAWVNQGGDILSNPLGISAQYFQHEKMVWSNLIKIDDIPDRNFVCTLQFDVGEALTEKSIKITYPNKDFIEVDLKNITMGEYQFVVANDLGREDKISIYVPEGVTVKNIWFQESKYDSVVVNLYNSILGRIPDQTGYRCWEEQLCLGKISVSELCKMLFLSQEFMEKGVDNDKYVVYLYSVCWNKIEIDTLYSDYVQKLNNGYPRLKLLEDFLQSEQCIFKSY